MIKYTSYHQNEILSTIQPHIRVRPKGPVTSDLHKFAQKFGLQLDPGCNKDCDPQSGGHPNCRFIMDVLNGENFETVYSYAFEPQGSQIRTLQIIDVGAKYAKNSTIFRNLFKWDVNQIFPSIPEG